MEKTNEQYMGDEDYYINRCEELEAEIEALKNAKRFIQNFAEEQHQRAVGLEAETEALNQRIERMIEKQSHYEAMAHAGGFEAGKQQGFFDRAREVAKQIDNNEYHTPED